MNEIKRVFNIWLMGDFKARRTPSDKSLRNKAFNIAKNPKYDGYQRGLNSIFLVKKISSGEIKSISNQQLANELHKLIIKKL